jgi:hypothetical protein
MDKRLSIILSMSIAIPSLLALGRISNIPKKYYPFVICLIMGLINEVIIAIFFQHSSTYIVNNIYVLFEFVLFCWLFYNWSPGRNNRLFSFLLVGIGVIEWLIENIHFGYIYKVSSIFWVSYSFVLVLLAIHRINWLLVNEKKLVLYNASFLICSGIIIFYSYKILLEILYRYAPPEAQGPIFSINPYLNTFLNLVFAVGVLCIPRRIYSKQLHYS